MKNLSKALLLAGAAMTAVLPIVAGIVNASAAQNTQSEPITRPADTPKWEAVSIKRCAPVGRGGGRGPAPEGRLTFSPGRLTLTCATVRSEERRVGKECRSRERS